MPFLSLTLLTFFPQYVIALTHSTFPLPKFEHQSFPVLHSNFWHRECSTLLCEIMWSWPYLSYLNLRRLSSSGYHHLRVGLCPQRPCHLDSFLQSRAYHFWCLSHGAKHTTLYPLAIVFSTTSMERSQVLSRYGRSYQGCVSAGGMSDQVTYPLLLSDVA